ncbi:NAD(P)/FAD-dependent oxidoreductase [Micromonospora coxensis]|uniref:NAD(P)/FAD-dependent oxidoreductase n=1 Tax=Micromonospora coxensis TaxID=356852 RepID=UPI003435B56C
MTHRIVVLGAGYAGLGAAKRSAARLRSADVRVTLVNAVDSFVERVRLHQLAAGQRLPELPLKELLAGTGVDLVVARVTDIDAGAQRVRLDAAPHVLAYDTLVYALGSGSDVDGVPGVAEYACTVADADAALRLRARIRDLEAGATVAVVGGGLTGIETAAELAADRPDLRVGLVTRGEVGGWLSTRARRHLRAAFGRLGVDTHEHTHVTEVTKAGLLLDDGREWAADAVVWASGFRVPDLARQAGFQVDGRDRMVVDPLLRSVSHPNVYGIGDAAAPRTAGGESRMSCQTALPMGLYAADVISDVLTGHEPKQVRLRYVWQNISLGRRDGVTQFTRADDSPLDGAVLTGRASARFKEAVTRSTVFTMRHPGPWRPDRGRALRESARAGT